jgi:hypothetical protein
MENNQESKEIQPLSEQTLTRLLNAQEQELLIRREELDFRKQNDVHNFEYAKLVTESNAKNFSQQDERAFKEKSRNAWIAAGIVCVFFVFLGFALYLNKEEIVIEIIKAIGFIGAGFIGGRGYEKTKK